MTKVEEVARARAAAAGFDPDRHWSYFTIAALNQIDAALNTPASAPETPVEREDRKTAPSATSEPTRHLSADLKAAADKARWDAFQEAFDRYQEGNL
jgi:hypothetical protein